MEKDRIRSQNMLFAQFCIIKNILFLIIEKNTEWTEKSAGLGSELPSNHAALWKTGTAG